MKKVIKGKYLEEKMLEAIDLLCDTVKQTLGPKGTNACIDHSAFSPFITNDGVTIARNIESDDEVVNTILELAKEASIKTDTLVGDGTTSTLVLFQSLFKEGLKLINEGINPNFLKKELDHALTLALEILPTLAWKPTKANLFSIAKTSAGDDLIGELVSKAYLKAQRREAISLRETNEIECKLIYKEGYTIELLIASPYYFQEKETIFFEGAYLLLINNTLDNLGDIAGILNEVIRSKKELLIMADDFPDDLIATIVSLYLQEQAKIILVKNPGYGLDKITILNDLELITKAISIDNPSEATLKNLGLIKAKLTLEEITFIFEANTSIKNKIKKLEAKKEKDELINKRLAMFKNGLVEIEVGAQTDTERREKKMRFTDAIWALDNSLNGVVLGSGISLYQLKSLIKDDSLGTKLLKKAIDAPLRQILKNAGVEESSILKEIEASNYQKVYNLNKEVWEEKNKSEVIDPLDVVRKSLANAVSIAGMLLTTTSLIINEKNNNEVNELEYNHDNFI